MCAEPTRVMQMTNDTDYVKIPSVLRMVVKKNVIYNIKNKIYKQLCLYVCVYVCAYYVRMFSFHKTAVT